jgi:hypothetical protein
MTVRPDPKLIAAVEEAMTPPTSYRDKSLPDAPAIGDTPAVAQPDSRRVPAWATGIAVASIGVGAGATGIGCAVWLAMKGLSMATLNGVLMIAAPFAGVAVIAVAVGGLLRSLRGVHTETHHHYSGHVDQRTVHTKTSGVWARTNNQQ